MSTTRRLVAVLLATTLLSLPAVPAEAAPAGDDRAVNALRDRVLFYNPRDGSGAVGRLNSNNTFTILQTHPSGYSMTGWTNLVTLSNGQTFWYKKQTGEAGVGYVNDLNHHVTVMWYGRGSFATGWDHIVRLPNTDRLFFYSTSGAAAIGQLDGQGRFRTLRTMSGLGYWTHAAGFDEDRVLLYNYSNNSAVVGQIDRFYHQWATQWTYLPGTFCCSWNHFVHTYSSRLLFYRENSADSTAVGLYGQFYSNGALEPYWFPHNTFRRFWTRILYHSSDRFFSYSHFTGAAEVSHISGPNHVLLTSYPMGEFVQGWDLADWV
ncbi:hypothetical protein E1193_23735 [Micromonospora sp. KC606]|uniref:hypothetical protein n=1 Tax=Micromonospora sp. KC606 TaxID=2530379 RepID=UPI00104918F8|nr:hypothetical protein [Micromonospora sp. KC606]TDC76531.1 hypothetical protein E1193_23735 [Micromonospora sp. KC606]